MRKKLPPKPDPLALLWLAVKWQVVFEINLELYASAALTREEFLTYNRWNRSLGYVPIKEQRAHLG